MLFRSHIEGGASTNRLDIRENKILKKLPEQYEHMKTLVRLARVFGFKARREEHMPLFSMGKADKYVIASVNAGVFLDKKREIELINAVLLAGTYWPYEHMDYTGYMIEYAKTLVISDIDAPREIELAHTLTETLDIFGLNIQTGVICPSMDT